MCIRDEPEGSEAAHFRRRAAVCASSAGALAAGPALSLTHGHPMFGWTLIGLQACLLGVTLRLLMRSRRLG